MMTAVRRFLAPAALAAALGAVSACASGGRANVPPGTIQPDQFLFDRGDEALKEKKWLTAREYFKQVNETYTQSPLRPDAKLAIGDTYLGEGSVEALVLAIGEFQEFLSFYPTHARADYAQYKLGMAHFRQMRSPQRDQTETRDTIRDFEAFLTRYPNSSLTPEVQARLREARDRLSTSEYEIGRFYYRIRWYPGAIDRLTGLLESDPEFTARDGAYFYLAESLLRANREAEALPYFEKLIAEFEASEHLELAHAALEDRGLAVVPAAPGVAVGFTALLRVHDDEAALVGQAVPGHALHRLGRVLSAAVQE
ncbi:MAG: outer membrane protein assembly factor BamD, partial [Luteitalea sp.]|nr:outer membrane protein assembly factor BamD [Luteitalea sp.]